MPIHEGAAPVADGQMAVLDDLDRQVVAALRANGRLSMRSLASELHISRANAYARVDRLERAGVITGYSATINPQKYGYGLSAYVFLKIAQQSWKKVRNQVLSIPEVDTPHWCPASTTSCCWCGPATPPPCATWC